MPKKRILLDSNAYLRLANSFHPLLGVSFGKEDYCLFLIPEFQKEFDRNPRLSNKFGWVNQAEYIENRKRRIRILKHQKEKIHLTHSYLWPYNIEYGLGASRTDVRALSYGAVLGIPVVTDDADMRALGEAFGIEIWGLLDLLDIMIQSKQISVDDLKTLVEYLDYQRDLPFPSFKSKVKKLFWEKGGRP
jgi:hypothetical protein